MQLKNYGVRAVFAVSTLIVCQGCGLFSQKSILQEKIASLRSDGLLDCADLAIFTQFVQENTEDRYTQKLLRNGQTDKVLINEFFRKNAEKATLAIDGCDKITEPTKFSLYLENSASMDGYVSGVSNFESVLSNLLIELNYHYDKKDVQFNFINSQVYPAEIKDVNSFFASLEPGKAPFKVGEQYVSELNKCFEQVLSAMKAQDVSIFVSDCIYSLGKGQSTKDGLLLEESLTKNAFMQRLKKADFSTGILQFNSAFNGTYYNFKNERKALKGVDRPYYIWIMGEDALVQDLLAKVKLHSFRGYQNSYFLHGTKGKSPNAQYLAATKRVGRSVYRSKDPNALKDIEFVDGKFQFSFAVDLSAYPDSKAMGDLQNYAISPGAKLVAAQEIPDNNQPTLMEQNDWQKYKNNGFTHVFTVMVDQKLFPEELKIQYRSLTPAWVASSSNTDDSLIQQTNQQTFGLQNLLKGVADAYQTHNGNKNHLFEITYNLTR